MPACGVIFLGEAQRTAGGPAPAPVYGATGLSWTSPQAPPGDWRAVCWSPERQLFVAVAGTGNPGDGSGSSGAAQLMCSASGMGWSPLPCPAALDWRAICWSPERRLFVAVASSGTGNRVMSSPDGISWSTHPSPADHDWQAICWSPERRLFVAVASSGAGDRVMTLSLIHI